MLRSLKKVYRATRQTLLTNECILSMLTPMYRLSDLGESSSVTNLVKIYLGLGILNQAKFYSYFLAYYNFLLNDELFT